MRTGNERRDFIKQGLFVAGAAGILASGLAPIVARAQVVSKPVRRPARYEDSFIFERKPYTWPGNKTLAIWIAPNVEVWNYDSPVGVGVSPNSGNTVPDVINYGWREYGLRVGLWRCADVFDAAGVKATAALNSLVCEHYPKAVNEMKKRGWEFMGHGTTNSESLAGLNPEREREVIRSVLNTIEQATGRKPRGWLGSGLVETYNTLDILAEEGVIYCGDWNTDDQPYPMKVKTGYRRAILPFRDRPVRDAAGRQQEAAESHGHSAPSHDHRPAVAHQISATGDRRDAEERRRLVCHRRRDHRRLSARSPHRLAGREPRGPSRLEDRLEQRRKAKAGLGDLDARLCFGPVLIRRIGRGLPGAAAGGGEGRGLCAFADHQALMRLVARAV